MNRLIKEKVKRLLVGLLVLTIVLGPITPTLTHASILKQQDNSTSISQRLSDDEMKEIVGGGKVVGWIVGGGLVAWLIHIIFPPKYPYTVEVYVHTNVPGREGQWYGINGYKRIDPSEEDKSQNTGWISCDVTTYWYGKEYLEGKFTIRGETAGRAHVEAKAELYRHGGGPLAHATGGVQVGKNEIKRIDLYLRM